MRDFVHQIVYSAICSFVFWVLQKSSTAKTPARILTQNTSKEKTWFRARMCLLGVAKPKVKLYTAICGPNASKVTKLWRYTNMFIIIIIIIIIIMTTTMMTMKMIMFGMTMTDRK